MLTILTLTVLGLLGCQAFDWDEPTALDDYVNFDDGYFSWFLIDTYRWEEDKVTVYNVNMTSQKWMDESLVDRPVWYHMMCIAVPDVLSQEVAYLYITGGGNGPGTRPPANDSDEVRVAKEFASITGYVGAFIKQVPNQGLVFTNDPTQDSRTEDEIIAWTWRTYITTHQDRPEVILRMPMTKAAKRGLDTIQELVAEIMPGKNVNRFIVGGGSKRGWTTWSVAATDRRVIAATPMVMSLLNFNSTLQAHYRNLNGCWSIAFFDYFVLNLTSHIHDDIVINGLWNYEDMFRYKERLALIPKLLISATGDEFFLATDTLTWWNEMEGPKWIMMNPNAEHSLAPWYLKISETVMSWTMSVVENHPIPTLNWELINTPEHGAIRLHVSDTPQNISAWEAHTFDNDTIVRKDFRLVTGYPPFIHPVRWWEYNVTTVGNNVYEYQVPLNNTFFTGFLIEGIWRGPKGHRMYLTTQVQVTPDTYPGEECYGNDCYGYLC